MVEYQLTESEDAIFHREERMTIPKGHRLWLEYEKWLEAGNTPAPYKPVVFGA